MHKYYLFFSFAQIFLIYWHLTVLALRSPCESGHGLMDLIQKAFNKFFVDPLMGNLSLIKCPLTEKLNMRVLEYFIGKGFQ